MRYFYSKWSTPVMVGEDIGKYISVLPSRLKREEEVVYTKDFHRWASVSVAGKSDVKYVYELKERGIVSRIYTPKEFDRMLKLREL